jgi:excisionase family DNA binding protein
MRSDAAAWRRDTSAQSLEQERRSDGRPPSFFSVAQTAELLGMSEMTLYRAIGAGEFPAVRIRGRLIIPARAIDEMVNAALADGRSVDAAAWVRTEAR